MSSNGRQNLCAEAIELAFPFVGFGLGNEDSQDTTSGRTEILQGSRTQHHRLAKWTSSRNPESQSGGACSVIEWNGKGPEIRTSVDDENRLVLATAGLYEIEEPIAKITTIRSRRFARREDNPKQSDPVPKRMKKEARATTTYPSSSCLKFPTKTASPPPPCGVRMQKK